MRYPANRFEVQRLRDEYVANALRPGAAVSFLAFGGWPYEAIVIRATRDRALLEYRVRHGGHKTRWVRREEVFIPAALRKLREARSSARAPQVDPGAGGAQ